MMIDKRLVGRCGLYCGICSIYRAYKDKGEYLRSTAEFFKCPPEKVKCEGCQALTPDSWGNGCKIVQCLNTKVIKFCYECPQYEGHSCEKFEKLAKDYLEEDGIDLRVNLERVKLGQTEEWLKECDAKFRCPFCGKPLPLARFKKKCYHCGKEILV